MAEGEGYRVANGHTLTAVLTMIMQAGLSLRSSFAEPSAKALTLPSSS